VLSLLVFWRALGSQVNLDELEMVWVLPILDEVEARDARFVDGLACVLQTCLHKIVGSAFFHVDVDMDAE